MLKKVAAIIAVAVIIYSIYYDMTIGTLSLDQTVTATSQPDVPNNHEQTDYMPYDTKKTKPGDTLISIAETIHQGPLPVSIDQLIDDFQKLNNGVKPDEILINEKYKFPVYSRVND